MITVIFTKITAFFTAILLCLGNLYCSFLPEIGVGKTESELWNEQNLIKTVAVDDTLYAVERGNLTDDELNCLISLQGLTGKTHPCIYIVYDETYLSYLNELADTGKTVLREDENGNPWNLKSILLLFADEIADKGYVLYRNDELAVGINTAFNYTTVKGWLAVPESAEDTVKSCGLTLKKDISGSTYNYTFLRSFYLKYRDCFRTDALVHIAYDKQGLRDLAVQQGMYMLYTEANTLGEAFMGEVLSHCDNNTAVLGWGATEKHFVSFCSKRGAYVVPADHSRNNSILASYKCEVPKQSYDEIKTYSDTSKHYCAIVFSDGDNAQWIQNGYKEYYEKLKLSNDFPMTWTFPPLEQELCSVAVKQIYGSKTENNCFVAGISGAGYMNPSTYKESAMDAYTTFTAASMLKSDMRIVTILDDEPDTVMMPAFERTFDYYSRFDTIDGGIIMLDPDRYASGEGKIWFSNGKPFVSVRLSLWYPGDEGADVPDEWIIEQAKTVNGYAADITSADGYSVINVHPWTISIEKLSLFVDNLDEHIQLVTADTLIKMITENVGTATE